MISPMPRRTDSSESTSSAEITMGSDSAVARPANSGAPAGFRIVAKTRCPARARERQVARPIPRLAPVTRMVAMAKRVGEVRSGSSAHKGLADFDTNLSAAQRPQHCGLFVTWPLAEQAGTEHDGLTMNHEAPAI